MTHRYCDTTMVPTYRELLCDQPQGSGTCGHSVKATGVMLPVDPPRYEHRCPNCGNVMYADHPYPRVIYTNPLTESEVPL